MTLYELKLNISIRYTMLKRILSLLMILLPICSFSQTTSTVTKKQIKTANLIFVEHEYMLHKIPLLEQQITNLDSINKTWAHTDSIRTKTETEYVKTNKKLASKNKVLTISTIIALLLWLVK